MKQKNHQQRVLKTKVNLWLNRLFTKAYNLVIKPSSFFFRKVFETKKIKQAVGSFLATLVLVVAIAPASLSAVQARSTTKKAQVALEAVNISTERSMRLPVDTYRLTQGFSFFHHGLDFATAKNTPVYTIMEGYVEEVKHGRWGFGNHLYVNHGNGIRSLYAHLAKIEVKTNDFVKKGMIIGLVGSTGWSSGPHLHFQVWEEEKLVNPKFFFEGYFGQKLASAR